MREDQDSNHGAVELASGSSFVRVLAKTKSKQVIKAVPPATKTALFNHAGVG